MIFEAFNALDYIIIAIVLAGGISGAIQGFAEFISKIAGYFFGVLVAFAFTNVLGAFISANLGFSTFFSSLIAFVITYCAGYLLIKAFGNVLNSIVEASGLDFLDALLGFVFGIAIALIFTCFAFALMSIQHVFDISGLINTSTLYAFVIEPCFSLLNSVLPKFGILL